MLDFSAAGDIAVVSSPERRTGAERDVPSAFFGVALVRFESNAVKSRNRGIGGHCSSESTISIMRQKVGWARLR